MWCDLGIEESRVILSTIERTLKLTKLKKVSRKTVEEVTNALIDRLSQIHKFVMAVTAANGKEIAYHKSSNSIT